MFTGGAHLKHFDKSPSQSLNHCPKCNSKYIKITMGDIVIGAMRMVSLLPRNGAASTKFGKTWENEGIPQADFSMNKNAHLYMLNLDIKFSDILVQLSF